MNDEFLQALVKTKLCASDTRMMMLILSRDHETPISLSQLGKGGGYSPAHVWQMLRSLEQKGMIESEAPGPRCPKFYRPTRPKEWRVPLRCDLAPI